MKRLLPALLALCCLTACAGTPAETESPEAAAEKPAEEYTEEYTNDSAREYTGTIFAMDTVMDLKVYAGSEDALTKAEALIGDLESKLSVTSEDSEIYALNQTGAADLSQDVAQVLSYALDQCGRVGGNLDISIYPVVRAWGFTTGDYRIPDDDELHELLSHVDYSAVALSGQSVSLPQGMQIDLGSIAKGWTADAVCDLWRSMGVSSALLNLGGNVQALGAKPDGSPWRVAVQNPDAEGDYLGILSLVNQAAVTSGGYERYFVGDDGETYWHIIDPATGKPAHSGLISVTIVGDVGARCDALSTSLFVMGLDEALDYWRANSDFEAVFMEEDGTITITEGLTDSFETRDASQTVEVAYRNR